MLIINAEIRTMAGRDYASGYIQIVGEKIVSVGPMEDCPADFETIDAQGKIAMPGLIDAHSHIGMWEDGMGFEGDDGNEETDPVTPHLRAIDGVNPFDRSFAEALSYGVTTVVTGPGSSNPISGQFCALKTCGKRVDKMIVRAPLAIKMAMGENPKNCYHEKDGGPATRMAVAALIREQLAKAQKYAKQLAEAAKDDELDEPEYDAKCEALLPLLDHRIKAHIHAHRADDIFTAIRIADEFGFGYVIVHGTEGHLIPELLVRTGVPVISGPALGDRSKPELANMKLENPAILWKAGVRFAICTDHPEVPIQYLPLCAALAVKGGLDGETALAAITINAARIAGLDGALGSLTPGKEADLVVTSRHPLELLGRVKAVFIGGGRV